MRPRWSQRTGPDSQPLALRGVQKCLGCHRLTTCLASLVTRSASRGSWQLRLPEPRAQDVPVPLPFSFERLIRPRGISDPATAGGTAFTWGGENEVAVSVRDLLGAATQIQTPVPCETQGKRRPLPALLGCQWFPTGAGTKSLIKNL